MTKPSTETPQPKPTRQRKWLKRGLKSLISITVVALLLFTIGWPLINSAARAFARSRMISQMEVSARTLPEITDHEALVKKDVTGTNGWDHILHGRELWNAICIQHKAGDDVHIYEPAWIVDLEEAVLGERWHWIADEASDVGLLKPTHFDEALELTSDVADTARWAASCNCIVRTAPEWWGAPQRVFVSDYFGLLATRVMMLDHLNRMVERDREFLVLVRLMHMLNDRFSKHDFVDCLAIRNRFLEYCVLQLLDARRFDRDAEKALIDERWMTPGTDPKLWLNNAAWTYRWFKEMCADETLTLFADLDDGLPRFPEFRLYGYPGYTQQMEVCTQNALDARDGVLDLRDEAWVKSYHERFRHGYNPINDVVG